MSGLCVSFLKSYSARRGYSSSMHLQRERERDGLVQYMESLGVRGKVKIEREKKEGGGEGGEKRAHLFCSVSKCSWLISNDIVCTYIPEHAMLS